MQLGNLLKSVNKKYQKIPISGISFNSKKVKKENVFFAIEQFYHNLGLPSNVFSICSYFQAVPYLSENA